MWCTDAHKNARGGQSNDVESLRKPPVRQIAAIEWHVWPPVRLGHANVSAHMEAPVSPYPLGMWSLGDTPTGGRLRGDVQPPAGALYAPSLSGRSAQGKDGGSDRRCAEWPRQRGWQSSRHLSTSYLKDDG